MTAAPPPVTASYASPLGPVLLAAAPGGLVGLWFEGQRHWPQAAAAWPQQPGHPVLQQAAAQLDAYFQGRLHSFELALDLSAGTPFQARVWQALLSVPHARTISYAALAARTGAPRAVRAVAAAVGRNPLSIIVPCHRVLGTDGSLTGYAGGLQRKAALLRLEGAALPARGEVALPH